MTSPLASFRRTKIVCTLGPASMDEATIEALVQAGMNVARLNFSHTGHEAGAEIIRRVRAVEARLGAPVALLQDLQGPKIRLGTIRGGSAALKEGGQFVITTRPEEGSASRACTTYPGLARDVKRGDRILIADGMIQLDVLGTDGVEVRCRVVAGGTVSDHKGINLPGVDLDIPALTDKDHDDLAFGVKAGIDFVAVSFVRTATDVLDVKDYLAEIQGDVPIIAKLEKPEVLRRLDDVLKAADGVMVARGDLGVEMPLEEVPVVQKSIIRRAQRYAVPVITATQMLESMMEHPRPTRAEASDVANAIFDGTDAVMLSEETATGQFPVEAVKVMARIAVEAERGLPFYEDRPRRFQAMDMSFPGAIGEAACRAAVELGAKAICTFTQTGSMARIVSKLRPPTPIIAFTPYETVRRRLALFWGVQPRLIAKTNHTEELIERIDATLVEDGSARKGDVLVITAGAPMWVKGSTNLLKVHRVGG
ncbi:MAG TPA: pyruvate kinase [Candidatus Methylomirabilis sp.]